MTATISADALRDLTASGAEYALLDVREEGAFSRKRLMLASCLPLSRLELRCDLLVPRQSVPIVLMDAAGEGLAEVAAERLSALGYSDIRTLEGGVAAWEAAGFPVYSGVNVMTKAFGEMVHSQLHTPDISADTLKEWIDDGRKLTILDARPYAEYHDHTIPGSISVPGAELAARVADMVPDPDTTIVVNCAGRTRSIIGCQSLINAGVPNKVHSLKNGTMGWKLAGFEVEKGATRGADSAQPDAARTVERGLEQADLMGVSLIGPEKLAELRKGADRTLYFFDVRTPDAYVAGHPAGTRNAPGGQLVQAMDDYVGVRNAVVVLTDPLLLRAVMTASWLMQVNQCEVHVLHPCPALDETGMPEPSHVALPPLATIGPDALAEALKDGGDTRVLDLSISVEHRAAHVPGAVWTVRGRETEAAQALAGARRVVLTGTDADLLRLAAPEIAAATGAEVVALEGGLAAWQAAGHPVEDGMPHPVGETDDVWYKPFELDDPEAEKAAAMAYLDWEVELTEKVAVDTVDFRPMRIAREGAA